MRIIAIAQGKVLDSVTGEILPKLDLAQLLRRSPGGCIAGTNLYGVLAPLSSEITSDSGWTMSVAVQRQGRAVPVDKTNGLPRFMGHTYISKLTYRHKKSALGIGERWRPPTVKWLVLDLSLFMDTVRNTQNLTDVVSCAQSLLDLAERRGIKPKSSPGSFSGALLRASECWHRGRKPAPRFISEIARQHLPGNYYVTAYRNPRIIPHAYYLDQEGSHHAICNSTPLPHPHTIRARGNYKSVLRNSPRAWIDSLESIIHQIGLIYCRVECSTIPPQISLLYPPWALEAGSHNRWIWTPELRLLDRRVKIQHIYCAFTSPHLDPALWEYAEWAIEQKQRSDKNVTKSTLLAAYGMLACRSDIPLPIYSVHGRKKPPRAMECQLPLIPKVYRSEVKRMRTPSIQNVIARGVIEAETRTRCIELARSMEEQKIKVIQIYADGVLVTADQLPFPPEGWRIAHTLTHVINPHPNSIISDELVRLPGIPYANRHGSPGEFPQGPIRDLVREQEERLALRSPVV